MCGLVGIVGTFVVTLILVAPFVRSLVDVLVRIGQFEIFEQSPRQRCK